MTSPCVHRPVGSRKNLLVAEALLAFSFASILGCAAATHGPDWMTEPIVSRAKSGRERGPVLVADSERNTQATIEMHASLGRLPEPPRIDTPGRGLLFAAGQAPHPVVFALRGMVWRVLPDGSEAQPTGIPAIMDGQEVGAEGWFEHGFATPVLSPDRWRLAYVQDGSLWIATFDQAQPISVLSRASAQETIVINSWAPDGSALLVYVEDSRMGRGTYHRVDIATLEVSEVAFLERAAAWTADGTAVLFDGPGREGATLYRQSLADGETRAIATSTGPIQVGSLSASLGVLAYLEDLRLCVLPERGGESEVILRGQSLSDIVDPVLSPDGRSVAFLRAGPDPESTADLAVVDVQTREVRQITACSSRCDFQWYDPQHLVFTDAQRRLFLVSLQGQTMQLARGAHLVGIGRPLRP